MAEAVILDVADMSFEEYKMTIFHYAFSDFYYYIWIGLNLLSIDLSQAQVLLSSTGLGHQQLLYSFLFTDVPYASANHLLE